MARGRSVTGEIVLDGFYACGLDVAERRHIGLANLEMDDMFALCFERLCPGKHVVRRPQAQDVKRDRRRS